MTTSQQQARAPDTDDDPPIPVVMLENVARDTVRLHVADPRTRALMWTAYETRLLEVRRSSPRKMPWEEPEQVAEITATEVVSVLVAILRAVQDGIRSGTLGITMAEFYLIRDNLAGLAQPIEDFIQGKSAGPGAKTCACGCNRKWVPKSPTARYLPGHRQRAYRKRKRDSNQPHGRQAP